MKILYTGGTFDLFHYGHMNFLKQCSKIADKVVDSFSHFKKDYNPQLEESFAD